MTDKLDNLRGQSGQKSVKPRRFLLSILAIAAFPIVGYYLLVAIVHAGDVSDLISALKFRIDHPVNVARLAEDGSLEFYTDGNRPDGVFLVSSNGEKIKYRNDWDAEVRFTREKVTVDDHEYKLIRGYSCYGQSTFDSSNRLDTTIERFGGSELGMYGLVKIKLDVEWLKELMAREEIAFVIEFTGESTDSVIVLPENLIKLK